ncbi:phage tail tape measure protein [Roseibium sp.]|uniref:phage tail tape measure protein n=1 Tax=Roseibium sp. TaxID=1936156 RepID=UPI003B51E9CC
MTDRSLEFDIPLQEIADFRLQMEDIDRSAQNISRSLVSGLRSALVDGKSLESVFKKIALSASSRLLNSALQPLERAAGNLFDTILPFAKGGVVTAPTMFGLGNGASGLMGEAGAEAILPLARGADGRLGVRSAGRGQTPMPAVQITVNTQDAESFRRSEAQVSAMVARAVGRGRRGL